MTGMTIEEELSITCEQRDALDIECARLEKEVDALRQDAERYRWLRDRAGATNRQPHIAQWPAASIDEAVKYPQIRHVGLDAAIDAAMQGANA